VDEARATLVALARWLGRHVRGFYTRLGLVLSAGLAIALVGLWGLSSLTEEVLEGDTDRFDRAVLHWIDARSTPWLDQAALEVTALGDTLVVALVALVAVTLLRLLGRRGYAFLLGLAVGGAAIINPVLKAIFGRDRPRVFEWGVQHGASSDAYPSGHALMSMVTLVTLAFVVHRLSARRWVGAVAMTLAAVVTVSIGLSRLYLGVHYPSDVLAGYVVGFAWAVFCALAVEALVGLHRPNRRAGANDDAPTGGDRRTAAAG
jgi:undecaprenyl-diphosphatase